MKINKYLKPFDFIIILFFVCLSVVVLINSSYFKKGEKKFVRITGKNVYEFPLDTNREIEIEGLIGVSTVKIEDSKVYIINSPCQKKYCIQRGKISTSNNPLVCLPNGIIINIIEKNRSRNNTDSIDAITR